MFKTKDSGDDALGFHDRESLEKALREAGISGEASHQLAKLGRHSIHLLPVKQREGAPRVFSKIGGLPNLPDGVTWPIRPAFPMSQEEANRGFLLTLLDKLVRRRPSENEMNYRENPQPYNFIAQIAFQELAAVAPEDLHLPQTGALYLLYDDVTQCWGFDPKDAVGFKVIYVPDIEGATRAGKPEFSSEVPEYSEEFVAPALRFEHMRSEGIHLDQLDLSDTDEGAYFEFDEQIREKLHFEASSFPYNKVRGWSDDLQNPMEEECALVTAGIYCGGPEAYTSSEAKRILNEQNDWVLLLQIDSDEERGMMWGDGGMLYLWIRESDLKQRNFDRTWLILQCVE